MKKPSKKRIREMSQLERDAFCAFCEGMTYGRWKAQHPLPSTIDEAEHGLEQL